MRNANLIRNTKETQIEMALNIDGTGSNEIETGIGFFDHMLTLFSFHSKFDLKLKANGDLNVCDHHTIEDVGILLGKAFKQALGDKRGIARYGFFSLPMDESLAQVSMDISGRPYLVFNATFTRETIGNYSCEMTEEFFRAFCVNAGVTLHINVYGKNDHHQIEAIFKSFGRACRQAVQIESDEIPSSKGVLE
ncbi:imidazoleglycerol-phosphate dehydratase HisB [Floccifex sp.]|uniref:imidazoleglycerol-phosphate dehydratase HisB n=1 Tax=Floccifex sp. TaxID=2815810 RepID=UPI003F0087B3